MSNLDPTANFGAENQDNVAPALPPETGVYRKAIHGGSWYMASVMGQKVINLFTFFLLARLLVPADYGVISVVLLITGLLSQLTTISFGDALTQRQDEIDHYLNPLWSLELARSTALALVVYFFGGALADFFHIAPNFVPMIRWSGVLLVLPALSNIRTIYLTRRLDFKRFFYRDMIAQVVYTVTALAYAFFIQPNAWALFYAYVAQFTVVVFVSYMIYPSRPSVSMSFSKLTDLLGFTKWVYGQELLEVFLAQVDKIFVGRWLTNAELGVYSKAKDLASTATNTLSSLMSKVGFAAFSKVQNDFGKVQEGFRRTIDVLFFTSVPIALVLALEGGAFVNVLLGPKWLLIVVPLKIFAFGNLFYMFSGMVTPVLSALGRPDIVFKMNALRTALTLPLLYVGITYGSVNGLSWSIVGVWFVTLIYVVLKARPILRIPKRDFYPALASGGAACLVVFGADVLLRLLGESDAVALQFGRLAFLSILYVVVIGLVSRKMKRGPYVTFVSVLRELHLIRG